MASVPLSLIDIINALTGGRVTQQNAEQIVLQLCLPSALLAAIVDALLAASGADANHPVWLDDWKKWPNLNAVSKNNLYFVPPDLIQRHSLHILQGAEAICQQLEKTRLSTSKPHAIPPTNK